MMKKSISIILLLIGLAILLSFFFSVDLNQLVQSLRHLSFSLLGTLLLLTSLNIVVKAWRWKLLVRKISQENITLWFGITSIISGVAAGSILPGRIEFAKPLLLKKSFSVPLRQGFTTLILERAFDFLSLLFIIAVALFFLPAQQLVNMPAVLGIVLLVLLVLAVLVFFPQQLFKVGKKAIIFLPKRETVESVLETIFRGFHSLRSFSFSLLIFIISLTALFIEMVRLQYLLTVLNVPVSLGMVGVAFSLTVLVAVLSAIPGGIGITEVSETSILSYFTGPLASIQAAVVIDRLIAYYLLVLLGSLPLLFQKPAAKS